MKKLIAALVAAALVVAGCELTAEEAGHVDALVESVELTDEQAGHVDALVASYVDRRCEVNPGHAMCPTTTTAPPTTTTEAPTTTPTTTTQPSTGFPDEVNTGPSGVLTSYTGPCTITAANTVIENVSVACDLVVRAANVTIRNSQTRTIRIDETDSTSSLLVEDVKVDAGLAGSAGSTGIYGRQMTVRRTEVVGGNRSIYCDKFCTIEDSYLHGQRIVTNVRVHASGFRANQDVTFRHNTVTCDVPDTPSGGGCSAGITMYGDWAPVQRVNILNNYLPGTTGGTCAYGGSSGGKPYSNGARDVVFRDNVFGRGEQFGHTKCGFWFAIADFNSGAPGNVWQNNRWVDGGLVTP